jgi:hypothetical protein
MEEKDEEKLLERIDNWKEEDVTQALNNVSIAEIIEVLRCVLNIHN